MNVCSLPGPATNGAPERAHYGPVRLSQRPARVTTEVAANPSLPSPSPAASGRSYERRRPEETDLHAVVREQLESFLARAGESDRPVPRFVEQELRAYLRCGILAHGFLRLHCDECHLDRLVPFSCKRRGFCPSCGGRRMADTAAHLVDCVLPEVPIRQWVLTLPYPLRYRCAYDATLTSQVLRAFLRALFAGLRRRARDQWHTARGQCGAVTFIQRFGSALNLNVHFHTLALDGVYTRGDGTAARFHPLPPPSADEVARVLAGTARRIARLLASRSEGDDDALARDEPLLATLASASLRARIATGPHAGQRWRRLGDCVEPEDADADPEASPRVTAHEGMSLHADVAVPARDRRRLERLCHYVARPPLAHDRLQVRSDGRLALRLKTRWRDGTTHILMERRELLERLVPLIPPPRAHQVRYHGVLAPCASDRDRIVPGLRLAWAGPEAHPERAGGPGGRIGRCGDDYAPTPSGPSVAANGSADLRASTGPLGETDRRDARRDPGPDRPQPRRIAWAELLQRVFELDALRCPRCGARMRLLAAIEDPEVARRILECLDLPARAPPLGAVLRVSVGDDHGSSEEDPPWDFDQTPPAG